MGFPSPCCCRPTPPCLFGGVLPYFEVTGNPVPVSSLGFKCPDCFIWNCSCIVYPSKIKGPLRFKCPRYFYLWLAFLMAGCVESIRRALVLGLVLIAGTTIEHAPSVGPLLLLVSLHIVNNHNILLLLGIILGNEDMANVTEFIYIIISLFYRYSHVKCHVLVFLNIEGRSGRNPH